MPAPKTPLNCVRCRQPLPDGSYFCVACGCNNESALQDRMVDIGNQLESRRWWFQFWNSLANVFPWIRWLRYAEHCMSSGPSATNSEPIVAEVVPPPRPLQFGLKTLLVLMGVCSLQFAVMSYAGVLQGIVLGLLLACAAFAGVFLVGVLPGVFAPQHVRRLDRVIVWLMVMILTLFFGTLLAGGGVAVWTTAMRMQNEAWLERSIGAGLTREMLVEKNEPKWVLRISSVRTGSPADQAGLRRDEVLVLDTTVDQFYKSLQANRGSDVELNVAICGSAQPLDNTVRKTAVLSVPK